MATEFLGLSLPVVTVTLGPTWASEVNTAFETIDAHDHSSGKGTQVPTSGININENLNFNSKNAYNLLQVKLVSNSATLTGASNANSVYTTSGNLYYTNASGTAVQITSGGSLVSSPGALTTVSTQGVAGNVTILPSDTFVFLEVDTTASRTITLPLASSVSDGRVYIIKDISGSANTNAISIAIQGSDTIDGASSLSYDSNYGSFWLIGDGVSAWRIA